MLANEVNPARSRIGHDVSANILLRSLREYVDVMALLIDNQTYWLNFAKTIILRQTHFGIIT
jgi:hypothetical protein